MRKLGIKTGRRLNLIGGEVLDVPNRHLARLADDPGIVSVHLNRPVVGTMSRVALATGARGVQYVYGYTGAGIGVAVIDSGITGWHDDLQYHGTSPAVLTTNGQRVAAFVDFVNGVTAPYDDFGHGTHVSGIIAGNGDDSLGTRAGIAPDAHLVSLKVLDGQGRGTIAGVIAALDYAVTNKAAYNIRVVNLSVGASVTESYHTDPLTLAARRVADAGIVVVAAAGNLGKNALGQPQYGAITAPGNAPWVLTVGAASHQGTEDRTDDVMAGYSSRGPTWIDFAAKPDVVAYGTGIVSLSNPASLMYTTKAAYLLNGSLNVGYLPYLSLTGTSMAAPTVAGTAALMLQANPSLTPNLVKGILQYTAERRAGYHALEQGAGLLNSRGAVDLAVYFATATAGQPYPASPMWSTDIIWGTRRLSGGAILPTANAWQIGTRWGAGQAEDGDNIVWGTRCDTDGTEDCDNIVWGTECTGAPEDCDNIVWGTSFDGFNIVWGTDCATTGEDCDNIVWGTDCSGEDCDNIVWGTDCTGEDCDNIVWGTSEDGDNIVWGTECTGAPEDCDNIVWGTECTGAPEDCDNIVWGTTVDEVLYDDPMGDCAIVDAWAWAIQIWYWDVQADYWSWQMWFWTDSVSILDLFTFAGETLVMTSATTLGEN